MTETEAVHPRGEAEATDDTEQTKEPEKKKARPNWQMSEGERAELTAATA